MWHVKGLKDIPRVSRIGEQRHGAALCFAEVIADGTKDGVEQGRVGGSNAKRGLQVEIYVSLR